MSRETPKEGVWWIRSESDPRWNTSGTSDSLDPNRPPKEARRAIDSLKERIEGAPPADLKCTFKPLHGSLPTLKVQLLFIKHLFSVLERAGNLRALVGDGAATKVGVSSDHRRVKFRVAGKRTPHEFKFQAIGSLSSDGKTWRWAWADDEMLPATALKWAQSLRGFGVENGIPEFNNANVPLGAADDRPWFNGEYLAICAAGVCDAAFHVAIDRPDGDRLFLVGRDAEIPMPGTCEATRMAEVIKAGLGDWGAAVDPTLHPKLLKAYARRRQCRVELVRPLGMAIHTPDGGKVTVSYDEAGRVAHCEATK